MCRSVGSRSLYFVPSAMEAVKGVMRSLTYAPYPISRKRVAAEVEKREEILAVQKNQHRKNRQGWQRQSHWIPELVSDGLCEGSFGVVPGGGTHTSVSDGGWEV